MVPDKVKDLNYLSLNHFSVITNFKSSNLQIHNISWLTIQHEYEKIVLPTKIHTYIPTRESEVLELIIAIAKEEFKLKDGVDEIKLTLRDKTPKDDNIRQQITDAITAAQKLISIIIVIFSY